jgi:hypothetical protein
MFQTIKNPLNYARNINNYSNRGKKYGFRLTFEIDQNLPHARALRHQRVGGCSEDTSAGPQKDQGSYC